MKALSLVLLLSSVVSSMALAMEFNFGRQDAQNDCANVATTLASRVKAFSENAGVSIGDFSLVVNKVAKRKSHKSSIHYFCVAQLESKNAQYSFATAQSEENYGDERNVACAHDSEVAMGDSSVVGVKTNWDQGWIFNPFCQSFSVFIKRN